MSWLSDKTVERLRAAATWPSFEGTRYAVLAEIGRGGMGVVYQARDEALDREVAIKVSSGIDHPALETRLKTEARILARLEHPGIVPMHDVGRLADGRLFYVMKFVRGKTLLDHLGPAADLSERLRVFERICEPVAFAHAHGFVHRDLKPSNIMIGAFGEVLVLDWGVAKALRSDDTREAPTEAGPPSASLPRGVTEPGTILGTRGYMSPEQARGSGADVDERSDIFGLGAILFAILTGDPPPAPATGAILLNARRGQVPRSLRAICAKALAPDPAARYQTAADLAADIARFRAGEAVSAYRESLPERVWRVAYRYRAAIFLVAAYLLMRVVIALATRR